MRNIRLPFFVLAALMSVAGCGGGGDDGPTNPPSTAAGLTASGWTAYEAGDLPGALADFDAAVGIDATYGPAHVGQGWARLGLATSGAAMTAAATSFTAAIAAGSTGAEVRAGRAAAYLGMGGTSLATAIADAVGAREQSPSFQFTHRTSFDVRDLRLIEAFALVAQGDFTGALAAADAITASGIEPGDMNTWVVDGQPQPSFGAAVLAHLHRLSNQYAG